MESLAEINDGQVIWQMLRESVQVTTAFHIEADNGLAGEIDEDKFTGDLPNKEESDHSRQQNRKSPLLNIGLCERP